MKALVYEGAWQMPLRQIDSPKPISPEDVVVAVHTVGICGSDVHGFKGTTGRRKPPIVMGHEFSGTVAATGAGVTDFKIGERVVVQPLLTCGDCENCRAGLPNICLNRSGLGVNLNGAYAEAVRVAQKMVYHLPAAMTWEQGAMVEPLAVAMHAVNLLPLRLMETVVIIGSGTIGLLAILAARLKGAGKIIVTDLSAHRLE
ncbi:MAG TPA: alcohol dehydrogenase catalytic domain-containing protein, partial [Anaerolineae bacterium]